jgi:membrane-bound ClpP family serine protease
MKTKEKIWMAIFWILGIIWVAIELHFFVMSNGDGACLVGLTNQCNIQISYGFYGILSAIPAAIFLSLGIAFLAKFMHRKKRKVNKNANKRQDKREIL